MRWSGTSTSVTDAIRRFAPTRLVEACAVLNGRIAADEIRLCSAVTLLETSIVIEVRRGPDGLARLDLLVAEAKIDVVPFTLRDARAARRAYRTYGKGRHGAQLNFGECAANALAIESGEPLLFKGGDFAQTDVASAI